LAQTSVHAVVPHQRWHDKLHACIRHRLRCAHKIHGQVFEKTRSNCKSRKRIQQTGAVKRRHGGAPPQPRTCI
jgi:hypothetical protein